LKLDFQKAYDTVHLSFLFKVLEAMGIPQPFIEIVKILFIDAKVSVCINGVDSNAFLVLRGVRQGCPLVPYLFLFVGEALNVVAKHLLLEGELAGVSLPKDVGEQLISQYADDVNFMIKGEERYFLHLALLLERYGLASGLKINWHKCLAYWLSFDPTPPGFPALIVLRPSNIKCPNCWDPLLALM